MRQPGTGLDKAQPARGQGCGAVYGSRLDLDNFKVINDSLGHATGDQLLVAVAECLSRCLRPGDTAARLGGDEFTVLLEEVTHTNEAIQVAEPLSGEAAGALLATYAH